MQKRWFVKNVPSFIEVEELRGVLKVDRIIASLLLQKGINSFSDAEKYFTPDINHLHNPFLMKDMDFAVDRINRAIKNQEKVLLFGDYDVDGTTAVALIFSFLRKHVQFIEYYIPHRYSEGYGISQKGIDYAKEHNIGLIISLDCGIRSSELIASAKSKNIDFIVCDHHQPGDRLPDCIVLDPKREDCTYPFKELSGCGVGFKLMQALCFKNSWNEEDLFSLLDYVAISIGADIVPVTGENRILTFFGMKRLNEYPRRAFEELALLAKKEFPLTLTDVVFSIAPRINAAGRLRTGRHAVELMINDDRNEIKQIASEINNDNNERREIDSLITNEALELIREDACFIDRKTTVVFKQDWHKGVVGIVASRLTEHHFRPTIVLTESNGKATGSARTVNDFNLIGALEKCSHLLDQYGGHRHAAGLTLDLQKLEEFKIHFDNVVRETIKIEDEHPEEIVDLEIRLGEIFKPDEDRMKIPRLKRILNRFEPFGPGNMKPVFMAKNVYSTESIVLKSAHLKLNLVETDSDISIPAIAFNLAEKADLTASGMPFDLIFTLETNKWKNRETLQLNVKDIRPCF